MKRNRMLVSSLIVLILTVSVVVVAQVNRPYRNGSVWSMSFIKMKPGMDTAYLTYLTGDWKREQEALKKDGQIISYKVLTTEAHGSNDWNIMLMTEYKDLATMEANDQSRQSSANGHRHRRKTNAGLSDRLQIREVLENPSGTGARFRTEALRHNFHQEQK